MAATCYWPNGEAADDYLPCPNGMNCCLAGEACLSNNLCYGAKLNIAYRGACTDKSWPLASCPRICYEEISDGWANLYACPNSSNQVFTCGDSGWASETCAEDLGTYLWVHASVAVAQLGNPVSTTASTAPTTITETVTGTGGARTETVTERGPACTETITAESSGTAVELGAGLGVGLGVPLLLVSVALGWFYLRARRQASSGQGMPSGYAGGQTAQGKPGEMDGTMPGRTELPVTMD